MTMQMVPFTVHTEDDAVHDLGWPVHMPVPRWGDGFFFKGTHYHIDYSEWRMEEIDMPDAPEGATAALISYHVFLGDAEDEEGDWNKTNPQRVKQL